MTGMVSINCWRSLLEKINTKDLHLIGFNLSGYSEIPTLQNVYNMDLHELPIYNIAKMIPHFRAITCQRSIPGKTCTKRGTRHRNKVAIKVHLGHVFSMFIKHRTSRVPGTNTGPETQEMPEIHPKIQGECWLIIQEKKALSLQRLALGGEVPVDSHDSDSPYLR